MGGHLVLLQAGARLQPQIWWRSSWYMARSFWVHPAAEEIGNPSPAQLGGTAVRLMLIVDAPDAVFDQAVAAGATVRSSMQDRDYGWRDGSVVDPLGHRWEIGKPL